MRNFLVIILVLMFGNLYSQNPFWEGEDKQLIKKIVELVDSPSELHDYFSEKNKSPRNSRLGFGYWSKSSRIGAGYIGISCDFYFFKDSLISYVLKPELPENKRKKKKYLEWYNNKFEVSDDLQMEPRYYNYDTFKKPLKQFNGKLINDGRIAYYMSPDSGLYYGGRGGFSMNLLQNRKLFIDLESSLNKEAIIQIMYSKNPASRLTAIEYYFRNSELFIKEKEELDKWTEIVFMQVPFIRTLNGCFGGMENSKEITQRYSKMKIE
ncbi:hypothetical protein LRR18_10410 [Mangrovimonas sp. AS39]|uniref:hypothetical protein n=1 Tax=Mangrovimonas futianensis TaxID=2895523 RepID=UPI001E3155DA|nr:hypothetical protein [Mangrovimonas futianensis]MCF1191996.1 hypothetical protein [Mangrovimonas futianensis]MCF1195690.1 hypothetical protein [Mangrovimonas futianensis]